MLSMTGLGVGEAVLGDTGPDETQLGQGQSGQGQSGQGQSGRGRIIVELRALNHRFQDVRVRLPPALSDQAFFLEQAARQKLGRGRYDITVRAEGGGSGLPRLSLERALSVYQGLCELRDRVAPGTEVPVTAVLGVPEIFAAQGEGSDVAQSGLERALEQAARALHEMRRTEGAALEVELRRRLDGLWRIHAELERNAEQVVLEYRARLEQRLTRLLEDSRILQAERVEQEVALLADRSDITEELVRLGSHLTQFGDLLALDEAVGRRLDFLLQEIGREVNTIGAKAQHVDLSRLVVAAKAEVERLREQVQNVD